MIKFKDRSKCAFDCVSLGEVMLRLDPGDMRIRTARSFDVWEGGGEYNVARGLRKCFGLRSAVITALADNEVGRLIEDFICQGGVDTSLIKWTPFDGVGRKARNGLNFTERGFGLRGALGVYDRGHTACAALKPGDIDFEYIFGELGVRLLHTGGIFAALSATTPDVAIEAIKIARKHGTVLSYDLNYRPSLWADNGGRARAQEVDREIARHVDIVFGVDAPEESFADINEQKLRGLMLEFAARNPGFAAVGTTLRTVRSATVNDWSAVALVDGEFYSSREYPGMEIFDRIGGGDGFASGLLYGLMEKGDPQFAVDCGAAHGVLTMTTPGDTSMASLAEVEALMKGGGSGVVR